MWGKWWEWIILAVVVGLIAIVAIPSYGDYVHRAQLSEAYAMLSGAKSPLAEYYATHKKWPASLEKIVDATEGKYTREVAIAKGAGASGELALIATMRSEKVDRRVSGKSIMLTTKDGGKTWICRPGTVEVKHAPAACRP